MKRTTLLLVLFIAVCSGQYVKVFRVSNQFVESALKYEAPRLEPNVAYRGFFQNIAKNIQSLINEVVMELFRQTRFQCYMLSNRALSVTDELQFELEDTNVTGLNPHLDLILNKLNTRIQAYLDLKPGVATHGMLVHPEIPSPGRVWSFITYHPLKQLFSHLETTLDLHLSNINVLIDTFYKKGWDGARYSLAQLQKEFREVYLNGYLLHMHNKAITIVYELADKIQQHVKPETWDLFHSQASQIKHLHNEIKPSNETISWRSL